MKYLMFAAVLLACACAPAAEAPAPVESAEPSFEPVTLPQSDGAGNRLEALTQNEMRWCNADASWCIEIVEGAPARAISGGRIAAVPSPGDAWPYIIRVGASDAIVGIVDADDQMYSGGGGRAERVTLFKVSGESAERLATLPVSGSLMIRACFAEADEQTRAGACHDQYEFVSRIQLDETVTSGDPRIVLETAAATFPGRLTRTADSAERGALIDADLVWARDDVCSYRRTLSRNAAGAYELDADLPTCADYLEP